MATSNKANLGPTKKLKPIPGVATAGKIIDEYIVPKTPLDVATYLIPYGKAFRAVAGITKKGAKYVNNVYKNMEN